jgi:hypothetical protein
VVAKKTVEALATVPWMRWRLKNICPHGFWGAVVLASLDDDAGDDAMISV